ncbi:MAG: glycosyltransferase family 4 protein [Bacteroidota bacterium]|nr:glycosyltransferase family 4 protein [Bacteroidota bacterium]
MKIALFTDGIFPYVIGGMQKHSFYLVKYLLKNGVYVDLYHMNASDKDIQKLDVFNDVEKKYLKHFVINFVDTGILPGHYIRASYQYSSAIFEKFRDNSTDVDLIYAKGFSAWRLLEEREKGFKSPPVAVNFHGYEMFQKAPGFKSMLEQKLLLQNPVRYNIKKADYLLSYGGKITEILQKLLNGNSKIIELPTGIESSWLHEEEPIVNSVLRFVFVGRFERRKGIEELNAVILKLTERGEKFEFSFIGPIPPEKQLKQNHVKYYGTVSDPGLMRSLLLQQDVLVCPSHSEGMPNVIMEGMACGLAIVASDVGAISSMVDEKNGILIEPGNESSLLQGMEQLIGADIDKIVKLRKTSVSRVKEQFLWEKLSKKTIAELSKKI